MPRGRRKPGTSPATRIGGGRWVTETFTATGTWTRPVGVNLVRVLCVSGGGSGSTGYYNSPSAGNYPGAGGGAGGLVDVWVDVSALTTVTVTIGGAAGNTSFGTLVKTWRGGQGVLMDASPTVYVSNNHGGSGAGATGFYAQNGLGVNGQGTNASGRVGGGATAAPTGYAAWNGTTYSTGGPAGSSGNTASRPGDTGTANSGNGGGGGWSGSATYTFDSVGGAGGSGIILVGYWI